MKNLIGVAVTITVGLVAYAAGRHTAKKLTVDEKNKIFDRGYSRGFSDGFGDYLAVEEVDADVKKTLKRIENNLKFGGI